MLEGICPWIAMTQLQNKFGSFFRYFFYDVCRYGCAIGLRAPVVRLIS